MEPVIDAESRPYWDGLAEGELRIQRCTDCERAVFYPRSVCPHCFGGSLEWITASGRGTVHAVTVAHRGFGGFAQQAPYTVALVDLEEGVRMLTRIVGESEGVDGGRARIGDRVRLEITRLGGDDAPELPCFRRTEDGA